MKNRHYVLVAAIVVAVLGSSASAVTYISTDVIINERESIQDLITDGSGALEIIAGGSVTVNDRFDHDGPETLTLNGGNFTVNDSVISDGYKFPDNASGLDARIDIIDGTMDLSSIQCFISRDALMTIYADGVLVVHNLYDPDYDPTAPADNDLRRNVAWLIDNATATGGIVGEGGAELTVTDLGGGAVEVTAGLSPRATVPSPADVTDGTDAVSLETDLIWTPAVCMTSQDVWFTTDPNILTDPNFLDDHTAIEIDFTGTTILNVDLNGGSPLEPLTTYYWQVASAGGSSDANFCPAYYTKDGDGKGDVWTFTTGQLDVQIITQPLSTVVDAVGTANFEIVGNQVEDFTWYKVGVTDVDVLTLGSDYAVVTVDQTSTLSVSNPETHYGEEYYCTVDNSVPSSLDSNHVFLYTKKLLAHWKFENTLNCEIDAANNGTASPFAASYDNAAPVSIEAGYAVDLSAAIDPNQVVIVSSTMENLPQVTVSLWMKANTVEGGGVQKTLLKADGSDADGIKMWLNSGNISFGIEGNSGAANDIEPVPGQWYHFVGVFVSGNANEGRLKIYVNGLREDQNGLDNDPFVLAHVSPLTIGGWYNGSETVEVFDGLIDDVRIYNYMLTDEQIASLYVDWVDTYLCDSGGLDGLSAEAAPFDVNGDCIVNLGDLAEAAAVWLECVRVEEGGCIFDLPPLE